MAHASKATIAGSTISYEGRYNHKVERFAMRLRGTDEVWDVSINHTRKAVRINGVVLPLKMWHYLSSLSPKEARGLIKTATILDGDVIDPAESE